MGLPPVEWTEGDCTTTVDSPTTVEWSPMKRTPSVERVLGVLADAPTFGLDIARRTGLKDATVYRVLARLRDEEWVTESRIGFTRIYTLTDADREVAASWLTPQGESVGRYRRRSDYVRAIRWLGSNWPAVEAFCGASAVREGDNLWIVTVHGREPCGVGDWIIEGVEDFYPVHPDVFLGTYEAP